MKTLKNVAEQFISVPDSLACAEPYCGYQTYGEDTNCCITFPDDSRAVLHDGKWLALALGMRFVLTADVERFPVLVPAGATGVLTNMPDPATPARDYIGLTLDVPVEGLEEWSNELHFYGERAWGVDMMPAEVEFAQHARAVEVHPCIIDKAQRAADASGTRQWIIEENGVTWFAPGLIPPPPPVAVLMPVDPKPAPKGWDKVDTAPEAPAPAPRLLRSFPATLALIMSVPPTLAAEAQRRADASGLRHWIVTDEEGEQLGIESDEDRADGVRVYPVDPARTPPTAEELADAIRRNLDVVQVAAVVAASRGASATARELNTAVSEFREILARIPATKEA